MASLFYVLFLLSSLSFSVAFNSATTVEGTEWGRWPTNGTSEYLEHLALDAHGILTLDLRSSPPLPCLEFSRENLRKQPYSELVLTLWDKALYDTQEHFHSAMNVSYVYCVFGVEMLKNGFSVVLENFLWGLIYLWSSILWVILCFIWRVIQTHFAAALSLILLGIFTRYTVKCLLWMLGGFPVYLGKLFLSFLWTILTGAWFRKNYVEEKAIEGFQSFKIESIPPRHSVLLIQYSDGSHAGYATCVETYDGDVALFTAEHVYDQAQAQGSVVSARTGSKIPLGVFKRLIQHSEMDLAILRGPPNWVSLLGCKAVSAVPVSQLAKSKFSLFSHDGKHWQMTNGEIVGSQGKFIETLCNTEPGCSGAPLFSGKKMLAVHIGSSKTANVNLATPIPSLPGLTSPNYVFETTAPTGRLFTDEEIAEVASTYAEALEKAKQLINFKSVTGKNWADYDEESGPKPSSTAGKKNPTPAPKAPRAPKAAAQQGSGNGPSGTDRKTTGEDSTPTPSLEDGENIMTSVVKALVAKINTAAIEKEVVRQLAERAMRKPRPNRRGQRKPKNTAPTSTPSTPGKYVVPSRRSPALNASAPSQPSTTPSRNATHAGVKSSPGNIPRWVRRQPGSAGPSSGQPQS
ncbi:hypothetical protein 1 [Hubei polero-like virus 1]|uniref:hypothetical protein 1 n=1 Tax=Hubei polero-like virus 1 TaxID=1923169 RepID=UPI00090ADAA0|nr:hypothetical protein 1 [Hubei polero-like virus 1]APG75917.1 hypothetical protein 1 [Hubei polero-like virus 1]